MKKYLIIVEETETGYSAFSPDVPGCGSTGKTKEEVEFTSKAYGKKATQYRNRAVTRPTSTLLHNGALPKTDHNLFNRRVLTCWPEKIRRFAEWCNTLDQPLTI